MDPITAIGLVASVFQIAANCGRTLQSLTHLKARYKFAGATLDALASEVEQVKDNLSHLKEIFEDKDHSFSAILKSKPELQDTVAKTLRGCESVFKLLSADLQKISASSAESRQKLDFIRMTSFIKNEKIFDDRLSQIRGHQAALTNLCQLLSMHSLHDITKLLQDQRVLLAEQSMLLKRTWSYADYSDTETIVAETSSSKVAIPTEVPSDHVAYLGSPLLAPDQPQPKKLENVNLIDLDDGFDAVVPIPSTPNRSNGHSPHLEDMRDLEPNYFKGKGKTLDDDDTLKMVVDVEKRESNQSISTLPSVIIESEGKIVVDQSEGKIVVDPSEIPLRPRPPSSTSTSASRRESEQSMTSMSELSSRDSIASSLPEAIMENDEIWPPITYFHSSLPPTAKDTEDSLESRMAGVLQTQDVNIQLRWAEDALQFVNSDADERKRLAQSQTQVTSPMRSPTAFNRMNIEARRIVEVLVHRGNPKAMFLKARWLETDPQPALQDFLNALARGYMRAAYYVGNIYEQVRRDQKTAYGYFKQGSDAGDSASKARLGLAYLRGELGLKKSHEDAVRLILQAAATADSDSAEALPLLAMMQTRLFRQAFKLKEKILPIDTRAARENYFKAAKLGHAAAQLTVGKAYQNAENDLQLPVDPALSLHYLRLASRQGDAEADHCICMWFWFGHNAPDGRPQLAVNYEVAFRYAYRAAKGEYLKAYCDVGYFYENGKGVKQNYQKAKDWYLKAMAKGDKQAEKRYDNFINKMGVERKDSRKEHGPIALGQSPSHGHGHGLFKRSTSTSIRDP